MSNKQNFSNKLHSMCLSCIFYTKNTHLLIDMQRLQYTLWCTHAPYTTQWSHCYQNIYICISRDNSAGLLEQSNNWVLKLWYPWITSTYSKPAELVPFTMLKHVLYYPTTTYQIVIRTSTLKHQRNYSNNFAL